MKIGLVSLEQVWEKKLSNLIVCENYFKLARKNDIKLIIFPEMTLTGFSTNVIEIAEESTSSSSISEFKRLASNYKISCIFGVVRSKNGKYFNDSVYIDENGTVKGEYSKIHPFSFSGEDKYYAAGERICVVEDCGLSIGLTICYDLRFPELFTALAKNCDMIVNIANWPKRRVEHWKALIKARAIESQVFVAGVNRIGVDGNNLEYVESSSIFNADGVELDYIHINNMKIATVDKNWTKEFKSKFLTVKDRNISLYKEII